MKKHSFSRGFTIIELIVIVAVIVILATIVVIGYGSWRDNTITAAVKSDVQTAAAAMKNAAAFDGTYPASVPSTTAASADITVTGGARGAGNKYFCVVATSTINPSIQYHITESKEDPIEGPCIKYWTALSSGQAHSCAISDGQAYCWGANASGQIGNTGAGATVLEPLAVDGSGVLAGLKVESVAAGQNQSCVVASEKLYCWGGNTGYLLGDGTTTPSTVPIAVSTSSSISGQSFTSMTSGDTHSCAISKLGATHCWGTNTYGAFGDASTSSTGFASATNMSAALFNKTITKVAAGNIHTCAVAGGQAYCWGRNNSYQGGNGGTGNATSPTAVTATGVLAGKTVTDIATTHHFSCAVASGSVYCWGSNGNGQLGNNSTSTATAPVAVVDTNGVLTGKTVTAVATGETHTCVIASGSVYCWGSNGNGQLGNATGTQSLVPVATNMAGALNGKTVTAISAGLNYTCALADAQLYCWGLGANGQLGQGSTGSSNVPVAVEQP